MKLEVFSIYERYLTTACSGFGWYVCWDQVAEAELYLNLEER